jgi:hypothetical protein
MKNILLFFILWGIAVTAGATPDKDSGLIPRDNESPQRGDTIVVQEDFVVFPNPANYEFSLKFNLGEKSNVSVVLIDALGREVRNLGKISQLYDTQIEHYLIDSGLPNGRYFIKVQTANRYFVKSLIIRR